MITWTAASPRRPPWCSEAWKSSDQSSLVFQPTHKDSNHSSDLNSTTLYPVNFWKKGCNVSSCNQKQEKLISTIISVSHGFAVQGQNRMLIASIFFFFLANHNSESFSFDHPNDTETNFDYAAQLASVEPLGHIDVLHFKSVTFFFFSFVFIWMQWVLLCSNLVKPHNFPVTV